MKITDYSEINIPGNAIKKAYLCNSNIKKIRPGDILLFYRSHDIHAITAIGVVDQEPVHTKDTEDIIRIVGKRSVYLFDEIEEMKKPVLVTMFRHHIFFPKPVDLNYLRQNDIPVPQSIIELNHNQYMAIKKRGRLDERFTVS